MRQIIKLDVYFDPKQAQRIIGDDIEIGNISLGCHMLFKIKLLLLLGTSGLYFGLCRRENLV